jgi:hypothetical protein
MPDQFEASFESKHALLDVRDRIRHEVAWELNRYARRIKDDATSYAEAALTLQPGRDIRELAQEAVVRASSGMFVTTEKALEAASTD